MHFSKRWPRPFQHTKISSLVCVGLAGLIGLLSAHAVWRVDYLPFTHDGLHHIFRLYALDQEIRSGNWYPLRFPSLSIGYGSAILSYYPPLALYLLEALRLAGLGYILTYQVGYTLLAAVAGISSFWLGAVVRDRWMGLITAFVYTFSPYLLFDLYARSALSEYAALAIAPLLFVALHKAMIEDRPLRWLLLSSAVALILLAHFLSMLLFLPFLALYTLALLLHGHGRRPATLLRLVASGLLGGALTAFYWLPAYVERGGIRTPNGQDSLASYLDGILPIVQLFSTQFLVFLGYYSTDSVQLVNLPLLIGLIGALSVAVWQLARGQRPARLLFGGLLTGLGLALLLITTPSPRLWQTLSPFTILQFPFRWLGPASLCLALLIGGAGSILMSAPRARWVGGVLVLLLMAGLGSSIFLSLQTREAAMLRSLGVSQIRDEQINHQGLLAYEYDEVNLLERLDWIWAFEYIPATSSLHRLPVLASLVLDLQPLPSDLPPVAAQVTTLAASANRVHVSVDHDRPWPLSLHAFYIPGWHASVDGVPVEVEPISGAGLAGIEVPAGRHEVILWFGWTTLRWVATAVSLGALLFWLIAVSRRRAAWAVIPLSVVVGFGGLGLWRQAEMPEPALTQPAQVEFADTFALTGYRLQVDEREVFMDLNWFTRQATDESYKIFVHVIDDQGKLWMQADTYPLSFSSRTNRWVAGQAIFDAHRFALPAEIPAGRYQVRIGLYREDDGQRLPVVDDAGQPIDDQILLDYIEVLALE